MQQEVEESKVGIMQRLANVFKKSFSVDTHGEYVQQENTIYDPIPYEPPKFAPGDAKALEYLDQNGYVVFGKVANEEQIARGVDLLWQFIETTYNIPRNDPPKWQERWPGGHTTGIFFADGIGQSEFLWHCRTLPGVKEAFAGIWGTDDLLVSFDGCGVFRPPELQEMYRTKGGWYHIDQNVVNRPGRQAVQGLLNFFDAGPKDGGLVVWPKSNVFVDAVFQEPEMIARYKDTKRDFCGMNFDTDGTRDSSNFMNTQLIKMRTDTNASGVDLRAVKIVASAGDLILWDSRCIHCNSPPIGLSCDPAAKTRLKRLVAYLCMTPTSAATDLDHLIQQRIYAFQNGQGTTHWPHRFQPVHAPLVDKPVGANKVQLTPEQAKMITGNQSTLNVYDKIAVQPVNNE